MPFAYDAAGNMTEQGLPAAATKYYTHDAWNRLTEVRIGTTSLGQYEYNALHWRTVKRSLSPGAGSIDEMRLMYYSANWQLLEERIDRSWTSGFTEDERAQTFWGKRYIDDAVGRRRDRGVSAGYEDNFFFVSDAQFSTIAMVNASNARVVERTTYDSYGKARHHFGGDVTGDGAATQLGDDAALQATIAQPSGKSIGGAFYTAEQDLNRDGTISTADRTTLAALTGGADQAALASGMVSFTTTGSGGSTVHGPDNPVAWDGYVFNAETGQYYVRFRWYDPMLGRWLEHDPATHVDSRSLYEFVQSSPIGLMDPLGLACAPPARRARLIDENEYLQMLEDLHRGPGAFNMRNYFAYGFQDPDHSLLYDIHKGLVYAECLVDCISADPRKLLDALGKAGWNVAKEQIGILLEMPSLFLLMEFDADGEASFDSWEGLDQFAEILKKLDDVEGTTSLQIYCDVDKSFEEAIELWLKNGGNSPDDIANIMQKLQTHSAKARRLIRSRLIARETLDKLSDGIRLAGKVSGAITALELLAATAKEVAVLCEEQCGAKKPCADP